MEFPSQPLHATPEELQAAANAPEAHAAAIRAAADVLRGHADWHSSGIQSTAQMRTVAMHAAVLMRSYLRLVADPGTELLGVETTE